MLAARDSGVALGLLGGVWASAVRQMAGGGPPDSRGRPPPPVVPEKLPALRGAVAVCISQPGHAPRFTQALQVRLQSGRAGRPPPQHRSAKRWSPAARPDGARAVRAGQLTRIAMSCMRAAHPALCPCYLLTIGAGRRRAHTALSDLAWQQGQLGLPH